MVPVPRDPSSGLRLLCPQDGCLWASRETEGEESRTVPSRRTQDSSTAPVGACSGQRH